MCLAAGRRMKWDQGFETSMEGSMKSEMGQRQHWHDLYNDVLTHLSNDES